MNDAEHRAERLRRWLAPRDPWAEMREAAQRWRDVSDYDRARAFADACRDAWALFQAAPDWEARCLKPPPVDPEWEAWWMEFVRSARERYGRR